MGLYTRTYADKSNTIVRGSHANLSLNPVMELNYGRMLTRGLIHFPHERVASMIGRGVYNGTSHLKHTLKMTNAASVNDRKLNCMWDDSEHVSKRLRAASFDLILFLPPSPWDAGKGFDYRKDMYNTYGRGLSNEASTWYNRASHLKWDEEGIYTTDTLSKELDKFTSSTGNKSDIIVAYQHFDMGNEPLEIDVTDLFNSYITGERCNNGICIAFSPRFEEVEDKISQYVGFFTGHTNSFYEPYIETVSDDYILDDRQNFCQGRTNRLYLFSAIAGNPVNLDYIPSASINDVPYQVTHQTTGAYYIEVEGDAFEEDTMYYDVWSGISINGHIQPDVEMSFVVKPSSSFLTLGQPSNASSADFTPYAYGINNREKIRRGDVRKVRIDCKIPYTSDQLRTDVTIQYRLYTNNGGRDEIDITGFLPLERENGTNFFLIDTESLIPSRYHVDIKTKRGYDIVTHKDIIQFDIVGDETQKYN